MSTKLDAFAMASSTDPAASTSVGSSTCVVASTFRFVNRSRAAASSSFINGGTPRPIDSRCSIFCAISCTAMAAF